MAAERKAPGASAQLPVRRAAVYRRDACDPVHAFTRADAGDILVFWARAAGGYTMPRRLSRLVGSALYCAHHRPRLARLRRRNRHAVAAGASVAPGTAALAGIGWHLVYLTLGGIVISMLCWNAGNQRIGPLNTMLL